MTRMRTLVRRLAFFSLLFLFLWPFGLSGQVARAQLAVPVQVSPTDGSYVTLVEYPPTGTPLLEWEAIPGATRYQVQVCPSMGCATPEFSVETYAHEYFPTAALADGVWYWRVRALFPGNEGGWSEYSSPWSFTKSWLDGGTLAPQLLAPPADANVEFFAPPIFSWSSVDGAAYYRFQIASNYDFTNITHQKDTIKSIYSPSDRLSRGHYYWRVIAIDHRNHQGDSSEVRHFFMDYQQVPTLLEPADGLPQTFTPEFRWTAVRGAQRYHWQISTVADFSTIRDEDYTSSTRYTPIGVLDNDTEYYWRVAAVDHRGTEGPWSELGNHRSFEMRWHILPRLLSPSIGYIYAPFPVFQWTPVAGKHDYRLQCDTDNTFGSPYNIEPDDPRFDHFNWGTIYLNEDYHWRVLSQQSGSTTPWSNVNYFRWAGEYGPTLIYPPFYYDPDLEPSTQPLDVRTDPTVAVPVFMWDRVLYYQSGYYQPPAEYYSIEVSTDPTFSTLDWYSETGNLSIAPTLDHPFTLTTGVNYYWRVKPWFDGGATSGPYSERWTARFDPTLEAPTSTIELYFPDDGMDNVYDSPLFGWAPVQGAAYYQFQIDTVPTFDSQRLYQRYPLYHFFTPLERLPAETYYWRVRALDAGGTPLGEWSETRRLFITHQLRLHMECSGSPYGPCPPLNHPINGLDASKTRIANDPSFDTSPLAYDLQGLYLAQDATNWYLTIDRYPTNTNDMNYVFYVDLDHEEGSGGTTNPHGFGTHADSLYLPEIVLVAHHNTAGNIDQVYLYRWEGGYYWEAYTLGEVGGLWSDGGPYGEFLELTIPKTQFDVFSYIGTVLVQAFTADAGGQAVDTVPSEATTPVATLSNFTAVADKLNPLHPWDNPFDNPVVYHTNPLLSFSKPLYQSIVTGYDIEVARDSAFTQKVLEGSWDCGPKPLYWFMSTRWGSVKTYEENITLYWRVRMDHGDRLSPWSQPVRFTKFNFTPLSMTAQYGFATPTFRWGRVEGASQYVLHVDDDPEFGSYKTYTSRNVNFTPKDAYADGTWYWRMQTKDGDNQESAFTEIYSFTKRMPSPILSDPVDGVTINELPTFNWQEVLYPTGSPEPVMNAFRYRLWVDDDPNFTSPLIKKDGLYINSFSLDLTVNKMEDGTYYWKVAIIDSGGNQGPYSEVASFYKAYLQPVSLETKFDPSPNLKWAPLDGAAYYQVQICKDENYSDCENPVNTDHTHYIATGEYLPGVYYWRVRMCDQKGACGPYYEDRLASGYLTYIPLLLNDTSP
ncbi:MAG: hypothetical protein JXA37_05905 [Chloroflexia bacterium]|nr:hypothetical protein [Chloroflexia bacterium]